MSPARKIVLDATPLAGTWGGVARFTQELLHGLSQSHSGFQYETWSDQTEPKPQGWDRRWWAWGLPRRLAQHKVALFHGTDFAVPYWGACPTVMTVHDLSPWRFPEAANRRVRERCGWLLRLRIPSYIHTPSQAIRQELIEAFGWPAERVAAIPLAASAARQPESACPWPRPYVFYLGALEPRKNLPLLLAAAKLLWEAGQEFDLLLAGQARPGFQLPAHENLHLLGALPEAQLNAFYSHALVTVYPSLYEGFGLPVLEAMQCGSPVLASDLPVLRETGGEAAAYASPGDARAWRDALAALLAHPSRRAEHRASGLAQAAKFSWAATAQAMEGLYRRAIH